MGHSHGGISITLAVAALCDVGCIVLAEGISWMMLPGPRLSSSISPFLSTDMPIFDAALKVHERIHA